MSEDLFLGKYNKLHHKALLLKRCVFDLNYNYLAADEEIANGYLTLDMIKDTEEKLKEKMLRLCKDIEAEIGNV